MKKILSIALVAALCSCAGASTQQNLETTTQKGNYSVVKDKYEVINTVRLTVAEGKRLIAKGLLENEEVKKKLEKGMVIITRGTTNTYIAEEFVQFAEPRGALVTGKITPVGQADFSKGVERVGEIVLVDGKITDLAYADALSKMSDGDIVFKGANLLNYDKGQVGVCIGAPNGGTVGAFMPYVSSGAARWFVPVGLEKDCSGDLFEYYELLAAADNRDKATLLSVTDQADVYTEIEAIKEFADVDIYPIASGGVAGAEGGISLMLCGSIAEVQKATAAAESVLGEGEFAE